MEILIPIIAAILGAILGSFACCQAWRLRLRLQNKKDPGQRSVCMECGKRLSWGDNIPIVSWIILRGRCRHCHKPIGRAEIIAELGTAAAAAILSIIYLMPIFDSALPFLAIIIRIILTVVVAALLVALITLAVYDGKWGELPTRLLVIAIVIATLVFFLTQLLAFVSIGAIDWLGIISTGVGILIMAGTCFAFYKLSEETLMGGGDWLLALALALLLGNWWLALWALTISCLLAVVISAPSATKTGQHKIFFGPFLVAGTFITLACQFLLLNFI